MRCTILIEENRTQLVLHPQCDHDKYVLDILVNMPNTHRTNLYQRQGGYTAFNEYGLAYGDQGQNEDLMIVFDAPEEQPGDS
jgi:hypothetical protein